MFFNIKEIDAPRLAQLLEDRPADLRVLDVRQPNEHAAGVVEGAELLPLHLLPVKLAELLREHTYVLVCRSGARSAQACAFMQQQGFDNVFNLRGGMLAWAQSGLPAVSPAA